MAGCLELSDFRSNPNHLMNVINDYYFDMFVVQDFSKVFKLFFFPHKWFSVVFSASAVQIHVPFFSTIPSNVDNSPLCQTACLGAKHF